ncbi:MAG TPA: hypothetical protein VNE82_13710 [Candidatus Binataceae bacterium]|nr:hypothetical protein [Candidatus Binataceae bacterium]
MQPEGREFADRMVRARAGKGLGFGETPQSALGEIHLNYGEVCGLYNEDGPEPDEMLAGFVIHDLARFPQSYPRPDLTHLPAGGVYECGELWALAPGAARLARHAGFILAGLRKAKAILVYPLLRPRDLSGSYKTFSRAGEPIRWPYLKTLDGNEVWVQAMVLEGLALEMTVNIATALSFEAFDGQTLRFRNPFPIAPKINRRIPLRTPGAQEIRGNRVLQLRR